MKTFHLRVYVGPTMVESMASKFREANIPVTVEGTAHIHCVLTAESDPREEFRTRLKEHFGHAFCLTYRDVEVIREMAHPTEDSYQ